MTNGLQSSWLGFRSKDACFCPNKLSRSCGLLWHQAPLHRHAPRCFVPASKAAAYTANSRASVVTRPAKQQPSRHKGAAYALWSRQITVRRLPSACTVSTAHCASRGVSAQEACGVLQVLEKAAKLANLMTLQSLSGKTCRDYSVPSRHISNIASRKQ